MSKSTTILWYRRDLRVHDHPALAAARKAGRLVPVFCFDDRLLEGRHASGPRVRFMLECLRELDESLRRRGSGLVVRHGAPEREIPMLAAELGASEVHVTTDAGPYGRRRDQAVRARLDRHGVRLVAHPGLAVAADTSAIRTQKGDPHRIFSPFHRAWLEAPRRDVLGAPRALEPLPSAIAKGRIPDATALGLFDEAPDRMSGGERPGRERLARFLRERVRDYAHDADHLDAEGTSRLSAYLRFGCVSPREVEARLPRGSGADAFRRQLCWRDFYLQLLFHNPENAREEFQERYRGALDWTGSDEEFESWCEGRTGFPLVDAAMRQLRREGFVHNRARLVAGSFLTKSLGIDWRRGERWYMRWLVDGDQANNNGNWQWIASVGADPQPVFRRIYNPARHQERYDPDGAYVRYFVPELRDVPNEYLAEPWWMPAEVQRESGCTIGGDYPEPIVDLAEARREALDRYAA